jgi:hypothetical protein
MKRLAKIYDEYSSAIKLLGIVLPLIFAAWKYLSIYIDLPDRMDAFEKRAQRDSSYYIEIIHNHDSSLKQHNKWLMDDYDSLTSIRNQLKRK